MPWLHLAVCALAGWFIACDARIPRPERTVCRQKGKKMPLVSIVTPVYNAARWLPETLASVRAQTLTDWEQILVDDSSTDNSFAIAETAAREDARLRLVCTAHNIGPSAARNLAIEVARGRFIAFLDADDLWLPEKLARSIEWLTSIRVRLHLPRLPAYLQRRVARGCTHPGAGETRSAHVAYPPRPRRLSEHRHRSPASARFSIPKPLPLSS